MNQPINDGGAAFPMGYHPEGNSADHPGMTLRDYFAASALQGLLGNNEFHVDTDVESEIPNAIAKHAYQAADAMIKAREVKP